MIETREFVAWSNGYYQAVIGCTDNTNPYRETDLREEWRDGFKQAISDGKWGTHPDYKSK